MTTLFWWWIYYLNTSDFYGMCGSGRSMNHHSVDTCCRYAVSHNDDDKKSGNRYVSSSIRIQHHSKYNVSTFKPIGKRQSCPVHHRLASVVHTVVVPWSKDKAEHKDKVELKDENKDDVSCTRNVLLTVQWWPVSRPVPLLPDLGFSLLHQVLLRILFSVRVTCLTSIVLHFTVTTFSPKVLRSDCVYDYRSRQASERNIRSQASNRQSKNSKQGQRIHHLHTYSPPTYAITVSKIIVHHHLLNRPTAHPPSIK